MLPTIAMPLSMDKSVSDLVATHSVCALILERYQIDYCTEGHRSLLAACNKRRLDPARVLFNCATAIRLRDDREDVDLESLSTKQLLLRIIARHHRYLLDMSPLLHRLAERVATGHGERQPVLRTIATAVKALATTLFHHIAEEERTILPACGSGNAPLVRGKLAAAHAEHDHIVASLETLRKLCNNFACDESACLEQRALFAELEHFEQETNRCVQVENDVLFRRFTSAQGSYDLQ